MNKADKYYLSNLKRILEEGSWDEDPRPRWADGTPAHTKFITGVFEEYDLSKGEFPITTLRNTAVKTGIKEILWIYQKQTSSLKKARELGVNWWEEWNIGNDTIGVRYGETIYRYDLMNKILKGLKEDPFGRRHIINMYQYSDLNESKGLHPCAYETLYSVRKVDGEYYLDMTLTQRSNDYVMAGYINKIQYVALQMMVASHVGYKVGKFCHLVQNLHIYDRHMDAVKEILDREELSIPSKNTQPTFIREYPSLELTTNKSFYDITIDDFKVKGIDGIQKLSQKLEIAI
jgi:thymidylate synthase